MISIHLSRIESDNLKDGEIFSECKAARYIQMPVYFLRWDRQKYRPALITHLRNHFGDVLYRVQDLDAFTVILRRQAHAEAKLTCLDTDISYENAFRLCLDTIKYQLRLDARRKD